MKLSVIIPNHNTATTIEHQVDAVFRQEWADGFEVVVIDNRSTDDSLAVLTRCRDRFPHLQIVSANERAGAGYARNCGVRASTGEALVFCDADDEVAPGWLAAMGAALREHNFVAARIDLDKLNDPRWSAGRYILKAAAFSAYRTLRICPMQPGRRSASNDGFMMRSEGSMRRFGSSRTPITA